ncbi:MAG: hypothetical protein QOJ99_5659 [Bryobacterales bacterium]|nr:hypothetical protein [Bryobacterales bacterium]
MPCDHPSPASQSPEHLTIAATWIPEWPRRTVEATCCHRARTSGEEFRRVTNEHSKGGEDYGDEIERDRNGDQAQGGLLQIILIQHAKYSKKQVLPYQNPQDRPVNTDAKSLGLNGGRDRNRTCHLPHVKPAEAFFQMFKFHSVLWLFNNSGICSSLSQKVLWHQQIGFDSVLIRSPKVSPVP